MASLSIENQAEIDKLEVVCEFPEVFPDEIPDVPPEREVEFRLILFLERSLCLLHLIVCQLLSWLN